MLFLPTLDHSWYLIVTLVTLSSNIHNLAKNEKIKTNNLKMLKNK